MTEERNPPFTFGVGTLGRTRLDLESDSWTSERYLARRDEALRVMQSSGHDPRLWGVTVNAGEAGTKYLHVLRCEACGQYAVLPKRPIRSRSQFHDYRRKRINDRATMCTPVASGEMTASVQKKHRWEHRAFSAILAVLLGVFAIAVVVKVTGDAANNRLDVDGGRLLAIILLGLVLAVGSIMAWVAFFWYRSHDSLSSLWSRSNDS